MSYGKVGEGFGVNLGGKRDYCPCSSPHLYYHELNILYCYYLRNSLPFAQQPPRLHMNISKKEAEASQPVSRMHCDTGSERIQSGSQDSKKAEVYKKRINECVFMINAYARAQVKIDTSNVVLSRSRSGHLAKTARQMS